MSKWILEHLKQIALFSLLLIIVGIVSFIVNNLIPWVWITNLFVILRSILGLIGFMIDLNTLFTLVSLTLTLEITLWAFKGGKLVINWFK